MRNKMLSWGSYLAGRIFSATTLYGLLADESVCVLCAIELVPTLLLHFRLSVGCYRTWLLEHGVYELGAGLGERAVVWYLLTVGSSYRYLILTWGVNKLRSIETLFRNARWLEREGGEMHDIWYAQKRDRRALFLVPLLYWGPLRKAYPVAGFFELRLQAGEGRLGAYHISWLD